MQDLNYRIPEKAALLLALCAMFPLLGNGLATVLSLDRRLCQVLVVVGTALPLLWSLGSSGLQNHLRHLNLRFCFVAATVSMALLLPALCRFFRLGASSLSFFVASKFAIEFGAIFVSILILTWAPKFAEPLFQSVRLQMDTDSVSCKSSGGQNLYRGLLLAGLVLSAIAWYKGPVSGEALYSFGGSSIYTSLGACVAIGIMLFCFNGFSALLGCVPYFYILGISTARGGIVCALILFSIAFGKSVWELIHRRNRGSIVNILAVGILPFFVYVGTVVSLHAAVPYFPYRTASDNPRVLKFRAYEFANRYSRLFRLLENLGFDEVERIILTSSSVKVIADGTGEIAEESEVNSERLWRRIFSQRGDDSRVDLVKASIERIKEVPLFGAWPVHFSEKILLSCGEGVPCVYPHNLLLESAFYFGIVPLLPIVIAGALMLVIVLRLIYLNAFLIVKISSINVLIYAIFLQITGSTLEQTIFQALIGIWLAALFFECRRISLSEG